jgi:amidohydrolase
MNAKEQAQQRYQEIDADLRAMSRWLYDNPELSYQEHESSARLAAFMARHGFAVEHPAYGLETAFVARAGSRGPEVIICAEYDALPGVGQACGHNIIAAAALGAGIALQPVAETLGFRVTVLGTPAEEKFGGKVDLINAGAFEGAAASMMIHPSPRDIVDPNVIAIAELDVHYHGKTAHASAYPQLGINALDAFVQAYVNISTLRQHLYPTDKIHGIVVEGGQAPNIIPDYTRSSWYVRAQTRDRLEELLGRAEACFQGGAVATGCTVEIERIGHIYDELISNPVMTDLYLANSESLGRPLGRGADLPPGQAGSTDMGNVSRLVPSIHPMLSINCDPAVNHQAEFAAHTVTPDGERAIRDGALGMAWTVIDLAERDLWDDL